MPYIVTRKPRNPSLRTQQYLVDKELTRKAPEKALLAPLPKTGGRNAYGRITTRHRGGGAKKHYRLIDFARIEKEVPGIVKAFEYDPNRNLPIALVFYKNGAKHYMLKPEGLAIGDEILASAKAEAKTGNCLPLKLVPLGFFVHNVELYPGRGGKFARSAGAAVQLMAKEDGMATLKMPSGEIRMLSWDNWATVGSLSNKDIRNVVLGKAGRTRHLGIRPTVRGMAMNPIDHPHGGGEGRSKSGSHPTTPWGKNCKGKRTRTRKSSLIVKRRSK